MEMIRAGPIGETLSKTDTHWDEKGNTKISHIFVSSDSCLTSIQFGYADKGGLAMSAKYGGPSAGHSFRVVKLKHNEYVTGMSGVVSWSTLCEGIKSLAFQTNLGKHELIFDTVQPKSFPYIHRVKKEIVLSVSDGLEFGGFFGSCSEARLTSIGIYVNPIASSDTAVKRENV